MSTSALTARTARGLVEIRGLPAIASQAERWRRLEAADPAGQPFLGPDWLLSWFESQAGTLEPRLFVEMQTSGEWSGALAVQYVRRRGLRQLEAGGEGSGGDDFDCLVDPSADAALPARLLRAALATRDWQLLRIDGMTATGRLQAALEHVPDTRLEPGEWLPYLPLPGSFAELLAARSANFREQLRRKQRQFSRQFADGRLECVESVDALGAGLEELFDLHNRRRLQRGQRGLFEEPSMRDFHRRAATRLALGHRARLYRLRSSQRTLASLYGFTAGDRFFFFQGGLEPETEGANPGTVLMAGVIEDCIARRLRQFEFLRGDEPYKRHWTSERRRAINAVGARGVAGRAFLRLRAGRARVHRWLRH